ncbi:MAG TPA: hypothetical protein VK611_25100 [Acidimicrobiales bacterium]|nr:hypothetical protein [Acidimicrobiales bacterium]
MNDATEDVNTTPDFTNSAYHVQTGDGWSEPMSYDQVRALQPKLTEAEWQRIEALEATVGRAHEGDMP